MGNAPKSRNNDDESKVIIDLGIIKIPIPKKKLKMLWSRIPAFVKYLIIILISIIAIVYSIRPIRTKASNLITGSNKPCDIIITFPGGKVSDDLKAGILPSGGTETIGDVRLVNLPESTSIKDTERNLFDRLKKNKRIILVVGHETSTVAKYMIQHVYEHAHFVKKGVPIPLILPAATNPNITDIEPSGGIRHILRIPATDNMQVDMITKFLRESPTSENPTALIVDTSNLEYSTYIAKSLIRREPEYIVDSIGIGLDGNGFTPRRFLASKPKTIIFIGMHIHAAMFINQMKANNLIQEKYNDSMKSQRAFLFTDGVVSSFFNKVIWDLSLQVPIYMTAPIPLALDQQKPGSKLQELSYRELGIATRQLILKIAKRAKDANQLNRKGILRQMQKMMNTQEQLHLGPNEYINLQFSSIGDNIKGEIHLFEISGNSLFHSKRCRCGK